MIKIANNEDLQKAARLYRRLITEGCPVTMQDVLDVMRVITATTFGDPETSLDVQLINEIKHLLIKKTHRTAVSELAAFYRCHDQDPREVSGNMTEATGVTRFYKPDPITDKVRYQVMRSFVEETGCTSIRVAMTKLPMRDYRDIHFIVAVLYFGVIQRDNDDVLKNEWTSSENA